MGGRGIRAGLGSIALLVFCLGGSAFAGEDANLEAKARELQDLGARLEPTSDPENVARRDRIRSILGELAAMASRGGPQDEGALRAIARVSESPRRIFAMEGVLTLLYIPGPSGLRTFLGSSRNMDPAVCRHGLDTAIGLGLDVSPVSRELLAALGGESRPEIALRLVDLASRLGTIEAARAILRAADIPCVSPPEITEAAAGGIPGPTELEDAVFGALFKLAGGGGGDLAPAVKSLRSWIAGEAFAEARGSPGAARALARIASAGFLLEARPGLLGLLEGKDERVLLAVLDAIGRLQAFSPSEEAVSAVLKLLGREDDARSRALTERAAAFLSRESPEEASAVLIHRIENPSWEVRSAALAGLGLLRGSDAAFRGVLSLLLDQNREVRRAAFEALRGFRRKEAVSRAIGILGSAQGEGKAEALSYLGWATGEALGSDPRRWERWWGAAEGRFEFPAETSRGPSVTQGALWKLTPLLVGLCSLGEDHVLGGSRSASNRLPFAIYSFLAEGREGKVVLVDLGPKSLDYTNDMFRRYRFFRETDGERTRPDDIVQPLGNALAQLERRGIRPERVEDIVFTHLHADHHGMDTGKNGGEAEDFPAAILHASKAGWMENLARRRPGGTWGSYVDFAFGDFLVSREKVGRCVFEDDAEIAPGIRTRYLGGHSVCSQAVVVETADGPAIISSDEVYHYKLLEDGLLARLNVTPEKLIAATDALVDLVLSRKGVLVPAHDPVVDEVYGKARDRWLTALRPLSDRAVRGYLEHKKRGTIRSAVGAVEGKK